MAKQQINPIQVKNPYAFSYAVGAAATSSSAVLIKFSTQIFDTGSNYSSSSGLFTALVSGIYHFDITAWIGVSNSGVNAVQTILYKNGSNYRQIFYGNSSGNTSTQLWCGGSATIQLSAGDTIGVYNLNTYGTGFSGTFDGFMVSK